MSRLHKKCMIASGTLHGLLLVILIIAPAFTLKQEEVVEQTVLNFVPDKLIDEAFQRAAAAAAQLAQPPPEEPTPPPPKVEQPKPRVEPRVEPVPPKIEPKQEPKPVVPKPVIKTEPPKTEPPKVEPKPVVRVAPPIVKPPIKVDLTPARRDNTDKIREQQEVRAEQQRKELEAAKQRRETALANFSKATSSLTSSQVAATSLDLGTVGVSYASYDSWVKKAYWDAWNPPSNIAAGENTVTVKVVIRADGTVESSSVTDPSGVTELDRNIRQLLARIKTIGRPFPEGARESRRTYTIEFNLKAKLGSG